MMRTLDLSVQVNTVVVDNHPIVTAGIAHLLTREPDWTESGQFTDPIDPLAQMEALRPQLVISDISLGKTMDGLEFIKIIGERYPEVFILVLDWSLADLSEEGLTQKPGGLQLGAGLGAVKVGF